MKDTQTNGYADVNGKHVSNGKDTDTAGHDEVDAIQQAVGDLGRWQILVCIAISLIKFPVAWHQLAISFMAPEVHHDCIYPARTNASDQCTVSLNGTHVECTKWEYDKSIFSETIVSQWNLVCDQRRYKDWLQSTLMFGILLGNIVFGSMADRYGRKLPLIICIFLQLASGIGCAIIPWFPALFVMKLLSAMATGGTMVTSFVICMEIVGAQWRAAITVLYQIPYSLGHMSLAGLAYLFRHWQHLQFAITLPSIVLLSYWWIIPESPRWLLAVGKQKAACEVLKKGARVNKINDKDIPDLVRKHCLHQNTKRTPSDHSASFFDLFRTPNMRIKTLSIFFNWIVCGMGLFGLSQYVSQLAGDMFLNFALSGIIQVPGNFISWWVMNAFGRKATLIVSNAVSGICCLLYFLVPDDLAWLKLILICLGVAGMSISFTTVYLFSGELFPTVVRNIGVGASSMCARFGSITAPHVVALSAIQPALPPVIIGILALVGAVLCIYLPETAGCTLPETLQDGEDFGKKIKKKKQQKDLEAEIAL